MTQVAQRNNHIVQMLKRLKETLENDKKKYAEKVNVLVMTWERIAASARELRPLAAICIVEKLYKDTLNIMLQGEWPKMSPVSKTHLMQMLNRCRVDLCKEMPWLHCKFRKLLELVNDPWTLPSLERIMHKDPSPATPEQIVEFCESERGLLIVTRLSMLCSSRCEKVAIKLAGACFHALANGKPSLLSLFTRNEYFFIFDIYLCLLYKYKKLESIINALKPVSVTEGHTLVIRLQRRHTWHQQKIWKFSAQVATIAARYFVTVAMLSRTINSSLLKKLIKNWLTLYNALEHNMESEIRKIVQPAETSEHIYIMAETLATMSQQIETQMYRSLIMELYIRALTADINHLERVKLQNDREQMSAYEKRLAAKFLEMADLVKEHAGVRREFILTAFSIHPSAEIYRRVEEEAVASGKASPHSTSTSRESVEVGVLLEGPSSLSSEEPDVKETAADYTANNDSQDSGAFVEISYPCSLYLPYDGIGPEGKLCFQCGDFTEAQTSCNISNPQKAKKERSLDALILIKGNTVTESLNYDVLSAPSQVLEAEKLGLSSQVCADLVTLLGSNRYHLLTWVLEWGELSSRCLRYMNEADTIKSGKKELKFLEIDYNQYKDWPENDEEADCIEKGYEQWLEDENTETDYDTDSKRSNTDDSEEMSMLKTAIRRSQKQLGRYAESSSDSDDSRARNKKKRGRAKKRFKYMSDSGSVSDSLGSDGQKLKRSGKRPRKQTKDLRKKLCSLRVLEIGGENDTLSSSNDKIANEVLDNSMYSLPTALAVRSDPSVLKSLRAFRLNAHKPRQNELVHAVTKNCQISKPYPGQVFAVSRNSVFDCNDNKFITKDDRLSVGNNDIEMHFKNSGVKAKKYNDIIRTIKEDLISVSNIPSVANNATVQVVHIQDSSKVQDSEASQSTEVLSSESQPAPAPSTSITPEMDVISTQKLKPVNESHGSHTRKTTSSQSTNQNTETPACVLPSTSSKTYLSSALARTTPARVVGGSFNNILAVVARPDSSRVLNQQLCKAVVNKSSANQNRTGANESGNNRNASNFQVVPTSAVNSYNKSTFQNSAAQVGRTTVSNVRLSTPSASETTKIFHENERQFTMTGRSFSVQNVRATAPPFNTYNVRHIALAGQNSTQIKKTKDSSDNSTRSAAVPTAENNLTSRAADLANATNSERTTSTSVKVHTTSSGKIAEQSPPMNIIINPLPSTTKVIPVKYVTEQELQSMNGSYFPQNGADNVAKSSTDTNAITACVSQRVSTNKPVHRHVNDGVEFQPNLSSPNRHYNPSQVNGAKRNIQTSSTAANTSQNLVNPDGVSVPSRSDGKSHSSSSAENCSIGQTKSTTTLSGLSSDKAASSSTASSTLSNAASRSFTNTTNIYGNKTYSEAINTAQDVKVVDVTSAPPAVGNISVCNTLASVKALTGGENNSAESSSTKVIPNRNILATVLKCSPVTSKVTSTPRMAIYTPFSTWSSDMVEPRANVLVTQSATSNTIHYTAINPNSSLQNAVGDNLNSVAGDMTERVVKQEEFAGPRSVMSLPSSQIKSSTFEGGDSATVAEENQASKYTCEEDVNCAGQQKAVVPSKKVKPNSSQSVGQTETGFTKKQVFNNQKITILVQNNGDNKEDVESQQKNKLSEILLRDDQKTCITFRAVKRAQTNVSVTEIPPAKKPAQSKASNKNGQTEVKEIKTEPGTCDNGDANPSGTLCQYLVLEAINDPSGALPKFNQAFGKSYQIKVPQPIKMEPPDINENGENDGSEQILVEPKVENKQEMESEVVLSPLPIQAPAASTVRGNMVGGTHKPVKNVYIDKEIKTEVQSSVKTSDCALDAPASIPAIHMTEIQQPNVNTFQSVSKVARSTVVQQFIRKVPATGPTTLQAVNSFNTMNVRQVKTQDIVSAPTLIYATAARAQSQILIQRTVGRVNAPTISQVAPVFYTQQPSDQPAPPTQTLLLAAVPTGTRGVVPGTQLVRLPSNSGIWRMAPAVNPSRIVQFRPQNLVIQGNQDQGVVMHSTQPVLLHHLASLPVKPISVLTNPVKTEDTVKVDLKNEVYIKTEGNRDSAKICSMEAQQTSSKASSSSPVGTVSEHETVALMQDIKEFENVFEETKLKFEMEEQQGVVCLPEVEAVSDTKPQTLPPVDANQEPQSIPTHQAVLVQPQLMLHKPHMIITSATPNQAAVFRQKVDKEFTVGKTSEERLLLKQKPKKDVQSGVEEASQTSRVTVAYVTHPSSTATIPKPLVVVTNYGPPPSSPAPSITSQSSSSPSSIVSGTTVSTTAGTAKPPAKTKTRSSKSGGNQNKSSTASKPQQKPQEDASTAQKIYAILEEYAVQLRNSPDMNNRPAPRRRSNPPTGTNSKRKRNATKRESLSDGDEGNNSEDVTEPLPSSEDSSSGVAVVQVCVSTSQ